MLSIPTHLSTNQAQNVKNKQKPRIIPSLFLSFLTSQIWLAQKVNIIPLQLLEDQPPASSSSSSPKISSLFFRNTPTAGEIYCWENAADISKKQERHSLNWRVLKLQAESDELLSFYFCCWYCYCNPFCNPDLKSTKTNCMCYLLRLHWLVLFCAPDQAFNHFFRAPHLKSIDTRNFLLFRAVDPRMFRL